MTRSGLNIKKALTNPFILCLLAMVCCALWGSAFPFIKIGYNLFNVDSSDTSSQILFAGLRFASAGVLVIAAGSVLYRRPLVPKKQNIVYVGWLALFQTILQYTFFYIGLAHTSGTKGSIINSSSVFFAVIISCLILKQEKITAKKIIGCVIGFAGTVLVNLNSGGIGGGVSFAGEGLILLSSISYAVSSVLIKRFSDYENTVILSGYQFALGGAIMILFGIISGGHLSASDPLKSAALLIYLAFLSAAAYTLWGILLKFNDVSRVAVFGFMTPVFGCIFSALFLKETLAGETAKIIASLLLVCIGIIIVNYKNKIKGDAK